MQPEQHTQEAVSAPEIAPQPQSRESTAKKRGGKRAGAGRKPNLAKRLLKGCTPAAIAEAVATVDVGGIIIGLLKSKREKTRIETLVFVWDRLYGRPAQNVQVSGGVLHAHAWRPLASLSDEEVALLANGRSADSPDLLAAFHTGDNVELSSKNTDKTRTIGNFMDRARDATY